MVKKYSKVSKKTKSQKYSAIRWIAAIGIVLLLIGIGFIVLRQQKNMADKTLSVPNVVSLDKSLGSENAPVVVVEYGDYQCPACGQFATIVKPKIVEEFVNSGQVRFVFRSFQFIGEESQWAAEAAECANEQGKFWEFYDKLYSSQAGENAGAYRKENLEGFAAELGLKTEQFNQCLATGKYEDKVKAETLEAQTLGLRSTPSVFVNGELVEGGGQYEILSAKILQAASKFK
jgi:protein-disulfide isomerase